METNISIWWLIVGVIFAWAISSCCSNYRRADDTVGRRDMELLGELQAEFAEFDRRVGQLERTAGDLGTDIDRTIKLFGEYSRLVQQLRKRLAEYEAKTGTAEEQDEKARLDAGDISGLFRRCEDTDDNTKV